MSITRTAATGLATGALILGGAVFAAPALADVVNGTDGDDTLRGTSRADYINGFAGSDELKGLAGHDDLRGGRGDFDVMKGHAGADYMYAGPDRALDYNDMFGGRGNDAGYGSRSDDYFVGGTGADTFYGRNNSDWATPGAGRDVIRFGNGNDGVFDLRDDGAVDHIFCGPGDDYVSYSGDSIDPKDKLHNCEDVYVSGAKSVQRSADRPAAPTGVLDTGKR